MVILVERLLHNTGDNQWFAEGYARRMPTTRELFEFVLSLDLQGTIEMFEATVQAKCPLPTTALLAYDCSCAVRKRHGKV